MIEDILINPLLDMSNNFPFQFLPFIIDLFSSLILSKSIGSNNPLQYRTSSIIVFQIDQLEEVNLIILPNDLLI